MEHVTACWDPAATLLVQRSARGNDAHAGRAAQYVRMSTDMQRYSTANQEEAIGRYAGEHGLEVVRTYSDQGKSGLSMDGRTGLQDLLADVVGGRADFATILVFDVSRWGRFQDSDESAFYEYLCRRSGIRVEYCMEPFANDGTAMSAIIKGLKRVMAGEYSRELSEKVFAGKCRLIRMGYRQGGSAGFGLRRMAVDAAGKPKGILLHGESKFLHTDRVIQVAGPPEELDVVRWMFEEVADRGGTPVPMARELNRRGIQCPGQKPWTSHKVLTVVTNEKYVGHLVFNKTSTRLKQRLVRNPRERWVRAEGAFPAVVDPKLFARAGRAMAAWPTRITDETAVSALAALYKRRGLLSSPIINAAKGMPSSDWYRERFGGLYKVYARVGYVPKRDGAYVQGYAERRQRLTHFRARVVRALALRAVSVVQESKIVMELNGRLRLGVMLARCDHATGKARWLVQVHVRPFPDWLLIARLDREGVEVVEYLLIEGGHAHVLIGVPHRSQRARFTDGDPGPLLDRIAGAAA